LAFFEEGFRDRFLGDLLRDVCMNPSWFFPFDSPPKSVRIGARFWDFCCLRVWCVLGRNPSIPLDSTIFGAP
jgi:hypothetical protein